jgi:hypothetical protein
VKKAIVQVNNVPEGLGAEMIKIKIIQLFLNCCRFELEALGEVDRVSLVFSGKDGCIANPFQVLE